MAFIVWFFNNSIILVKIDKVFLFPKNYIFCSDIMKTLMTSNSIRVEYFLLKYCKCCQRKNVYRKVKSSRPEVLCKKFVPRNFGKFTVKHLCQGLFFHPFFVRHFILLNYGYSQEKITIK